ncbi:MAG: glycoside hydrolase family 15 protein [Chloroflexota bacterium]|nr:glycoside hydrolase family 15 protein [Chloroflexota bacterium]
MPSDKPHEHLLLAAPAQTRVSIPPERQLQTALPAWLYSTILGNGRVLVCLDETGSIAQCFYPTIDAGPHVRTFLTGLQITDAATQTGAASLPDEVSWLAGTDWTHDVRHVAGAAVVTTLFQHRDASIQLERTIAVDPIDDILTMEIKITNMNTAVLTCKLVTYASFDFDHRASGNCAFFTLATEVLTCFASDRYLALTCNAPVDGFDCDQHTPGSAVDGVFQRASQGLFSQREYAIGQTSSAVRHDFGKIEVGATTTHAIRLCFARSLHDVSALASTVPTTRARIDAAIKWWQARYAQAKLPTNSEIIISLYQRSLMVLRLLTDRDTGGILAAPEIDPDFRSCGGYGMCWPRDGAYNAHALDRAGQHAHAREFHDWALRVQSPEGGWYQRYYADGRLAPTWGLVQFDEIGAIVWAICQHITLTGDSDYGRAAFPRLLRACEYMQAALDAETGLAPITKDLWEERDGISTYACASTWGAFHELSRLATMLGETAIAEHWSTLASTLKLAIETHLWDGKQRRFLRGIKLKLSTQVYDIERAGRQAEPHKAEIQAVKMGRLTHYFQRRDLVIDTAILALSVPFGVFSADDSRMRATAEAIAEHLTSPVGGILRYENDLYRGGNPWVICTLWLAWYDLLAGNQERALALYTWVMEHRTELDLLPEQVDRTTGKPCWVVPLGWSHAMFLLVSHELAERGLLPS